MFYLYLIQSVNKPGKLYLGSTKDLKRRINDEHNKKKSFSTTRYAPWRLVYYEAFLSEKDARIRESKLKHHGKGMSELKKRLKHSLETEKGAG